MKDGIFVRSMCLIKIICQKFKELLNNDVLLNKNNEELLNESNTKIDLSFKQY